MPIAENVRIAMWSGPRNISTALMRAWDSRGDTYVCDEPFYAHYLASTDVDHPGRHEIIDEGDTDWRRVATWLTGPVPKGCRIFYQKHMAHHLLRGMEGQWLEQLRHAFLIRDPDEMLISLSKVMSRPTLDETGLPQQLALFDRARNGARRMPPVVDARDLLDDPPAVLEKLCTKLGVDFNDRMLSWQAGTRPTDGVWAPYWYANAEASTGFRPYEPPADALPASLEELARECRHYYEELYPHRITP